MRLYDVEMSAQSNLGGMGKVDNDVPLFDQSSFGKRIEENNFEGFKV